MTSQNLTKSILLLELKEGISLNGSVCTPDESRGLIILTQLSSNFLHNDDITEFLNQNNFATISIDLLAQEESKDFEKRYNIKLLSGRLKNIVDWAKIHYPQLSKKIGLLGSGKGAATALRVAATDTGSIKAIVCRSGRPDLVEDIIGEVEVPTLFVVGSLDPEIEEYNHRAIRKMKSRVKLITIKGASHLMYEYGKRNEFALEMLDWFESEIFVTEKMFV